MVGTGKAVKGTGETSPLQAATLREWTDGRNILFLSAGQLLRERASLSDVRVSRVRGERVSERRRVPTHTGGGLGSIWDLQNPDLLRE